MAKEGHVLARQEQNMVPPRQVARPRNVSIIGL